MNRLAGNISRKLLDATQTRESGAFETIALRVDARTAAMINTINELLSVPVSNMFTEDISHYLAEFLLESKENCELINELIQAGIQNDSALSILMNKNAIHQPRKPVEFDPKRVIRYDG